MSASSQPRAAQQIATARAAGTVLRRFRRGGVSGCAVVRIPAAAMQALAADPDAPLRDSRAQLLKQDRGTVVVRTHLESGAQRMEVAYKRWQPKDRWKGMLAVFRPSPAGRAWRLAQWLRGHGVNTPRPLFVCRSWSRHHGSHSYLATEWLQGALDLHRFGWGTDGLHPRERARLVRASAARLGEQIGRLHAAGVSHRDLKASNLLIVERGDELQAWLVDLEAARRRVRLSLQRRARDLARLALTTAFFPWLTHTDRLSFLRAYLHQQRAADDWKPLWRATSTALKTLIHRQSRRGQPLD